MSLNIPLGTGSAAGEPRGLKIPFRLFGGASALGGTERELEALRAVAAGIAVSRTAVALEVAKAVKDDLAAVIAEASRQKDADALRPLLDEVVRVQGNRALAPTADEVQTRVAQAIRADPGLAAAARAQIKDDAVAKAAARWVGTADAALLESAARAAAARAQLVLVGTPATGAKQLADRVDALEKELEDVRKKLKAAQVPGF